MDPDSCTMLNNTLTVDASTIWGMPSWVCWIIVAILLLVSALFSASENAFSNCNRYHFQALANKGNLTAKLVCRLVDKFDNTLVSILVGNNIVQTIMSYLSAMLFYELSKEWGLFSGGDAILSTVVMAALVYVISDTLPKILSKSLPNRMAVFLAYPVFIFSIPIYPIILFFRAILALVHRIFKVTDQNLLSKEEIIESTKQAVIDEPSDEDNEEKPAEALFERDETELIDNVFSFDQVKVRQVYTALADTFALNATNLSISDINKTIMDCPYSRLPIYEGEKTNIIGVLVVKIYFEEYAKDPHLDFRSIMEQPVYIDIDMTLNDAFEKLNAALTHLGVVVSGDKTVGIVSMEDILEELVEDIDESNEHKVVYRKGEKGC